MLVVFHDRLAGKPLVMAGVSEKTKVIVNSNKSLLGTGLKCAPESFL